ncbi:MAG: hypothetical protein M3N68_14935 [Actinomycetota bacterium]|nr:hypothetical protein [Actinomycetota bacterium]
MDGCAKPTSARWLVVILTLGVLASSVSGAGAAEKPDPRARRKEVQQQRAKVAAELDVLRASDAEVERALDDLDSNLRGQESHAAATRQAAEASASAAAAAREEERRSEVELRALRQSMRRLAVSAYVSGPSEELVIALDSDSVAEMATKRHLLEFALGHSGDLADELRAAGEDLGARRRAAENAEKQAAGRRREAEASLGAVVQAQEKQRRVASSVDDRVDRALAEAQSLAALDAQLAADIAKRQEALTRRITAPPPEPGAPIRPSRRVGGVSVTSVRGIVVNTQIAARLSDLLPGFQWLAGNASRFGFYNLPSEPWHWSVNGN